MLARSETLPAFSRSLKGEFQMRSRPYRLLLVAALIGALLLCWSVYAQEKKSSRTVWEYTMVSMPRDEISKMSELGAQGWELAFVRKEEEMLGNVRHTTVIYYLKRPKQ